MRLIFTHTEKEYLAAVRAYFWSSTELIFRITLFYLFLAGGIVLISVTVGVDIPLWAILAFVVLLGVGLFHAYLIDFPRRHFRSDPKFRDEYTLTFADEGVGFKTSNIDAKVAWSLYTKFIENKSFYLLVYGKEPASVTVIPKRVFESSEQEDAFRMLLKEHINEKNN
jgi:hypothetical protein